MELNAAQQAAVERWGQDVCVVAGPGSGKTRVLIERFRWLVEAKGISPQRILAVTFTEKAATEIKKRLIIAFADSEQRREEIERAWVSTIHGFCTRLLKEHAIAANLDPDFALLEEARAQIVQRRLAEESLDALLRRRPAEMRRLLAGLDTSGAELAQSLLDWYEEARTAGVPVGSFRNPEAPQDDGWAEVAAAARVILSEAPVGTPNQTQHHRKAHGWAREALALERGAGWRDRIAMLEAAPRASGFSAKSRAKGVAQELKDSVIPQVMGRIVLAEHADLYPLCIEAMAGLHGAYVEWKRERGLIDFHDLEEHAIALLESDDELRARIRGSFDQILMDELQDTNRLQWRLIDLVRSANNLFAVGDINQSIYYFRHADPGVFRDYRDSLLERGAVVDELRENYRSRGTILQIVNQTSPYLSGVEPHVLAARREFPEREGASVEFAYAFAAQEGDDPAVTEARWVARRIRELVGSGDVQLSQIAVLARTIGALAQVQQALDDFGVPSVISGGRSFYESREVRDLVAWLRSIVNPRDEIAMATVLRSPLVGISDETLLRLKIAGPLAESIPAAQEDDARLAWFWRTLEAQRTRCDEIAPDRLLVEAIDASSYEDGLAGRARANIAKLLAALRERWRREPSSLAEITEELELWRTTESEAEAATDEVANCVRLMSVHAAKGLEFPVVFLAAMRSGPQNRKPAFCFNATRVLGAAWRHPLGGKAISDPLHLAVYAARKQQEEGEEDRLLYVAMTRAEDRLICSASTSGQGNWTRRLGEGLGLEAGNPKAEWQSAVPLRTGDVVAVMYTSAAVTADGLTELRTNDSEKVRMVERPLVGGLHETTLPVTSVAQFAFCPRQYYLARYIRWPGSVRAPQEAEDRADNGEWTASEFGTLVHELLAGKPWPEAPVEALAMQSAFEASPLGRRVRDAERVEREYDFLVELEGAILRGQIDLWFEQGGELILVDYKTDQVEPGGEERHARRYVPQLRLYALALERLMGRRPVRAVLWYLRTSHAVSVAVEPEAVGAARQSIRELLAAQSDLRFPLREGRHCLRCAYHGAGCPAVVADDETMVAGEGA